MPAVTIIVSEPTFSALKLCAARHGRSIEAEMRAIIETAVSAPDRIKLGSALAGIGRQFGGVELDIERDGTSAGPVIFE